MQGTPADLVNSGVDFAELVGTNEKIDEEDKPERLERRMSRQHSAQSVASALNGSVNGSEFGDKENEKETKGVEMEASSKDKVKGSIAANYFRAGANWFFLAVLGISFLVVQFLASASDFWVSIWYEFQHFLFIFLLILPIQKEN